MRRLCCGPLVAIRSAAARRCAAASLRRRLRSSRRRRRRRSWFRLRCARCQGGIRALFPNALSWPWTSRKTNDDGPALFCCPVAVAQSVLTPLKFISRRSQCPRPRNHLYGCWAGVDVIIICGGCANTCVRPLKTLLLLPPTTIPTPWPTCS
jgi:hypothetical protein